MYQIEEKGSTIVTCRVMHVSIKIKITENLFLGFRIGANYEVPGLGITMKFAYDCFIVYILPEIACCMVLHMLRHKCNKLLTELR